MNKKAIFSINKYLSRLWILLLFIPFTILFFTSCEEEENYGNPAITNVRLTDPATEGQSVAEGNLGQMVVIQGDNLSSVQHVFFNNVEAFVNPTLVTDENIIVTVPSEFPTEINDLVKVITLGGEATYSFPISIPEPEITALPLEYVATGGSMIIEGAFFYNVESVIFSGDVSTTSFVVDSPEQITVVVPEGAEPGPVTVSAVAGTSVSTQWFRDNRNMMVNFDDLPICWGGIDFVVDANNMPAEVPVNPIDGNFYYILKDYAANTWWIEETVIAYCGEVEITGNKADYALAFEMWIGEAWDGNWFEMEWMNDGEAVYYEWPGYEELAQGDEGLKDTGWMTVHIPLEQMDVLTGSTFKLSRFGSYKAEVEDTIEFAFDNFRIIPINE